MAFNFGATPFGATTTTGTSRVSFSVYNMLLTAGFVFGTPGGSTTFNTNLFGTPSVAPAASFGTTAVAPFTSPVIGASNTLFGTTPSFPASTSTLFGKSDFQPTVVTPSDALLTAVFCPKVFGDERDSIITRWNQLQAAWGTGHGYYSPTLPPVVFSSDNQFGRFKAIGYSSLPQAKNEDGYVALIVSKEPSEVVVHQEAFVARLHQILGNRPNVQVCVEAVKVLPDSRCEVIIFVQERNAAGTIRRCPALDLFQFLQQPNIRCQLQQLAITDIALRCAPTAEQLKQYLDTPPVGIDPIIWQQAKLDNPCPDKLIPSPMLGFKELHRRLKLQEVETKQHQGRLDLIADCIAELNRKHVQNVARITELKQKHVEMSYRLLRIMVRQEVSRKLGTAMQPEEEQLKATFESLEAQLNAPNQFKGRLNELLSQILLQLQLTPRSGDRFALEPDVVNDVKQILQLQQEGLNHLVTVIKEDTADLKIMHETLNSIKLY